ncbi:MAG: hypothetical protein ACRDTC_23920 [Pseudonocardiaceae bacterium]
MLLHTQVTIAWLRRAQSLRLGSPALVCSVRAEVGSGCQSEAWGRSWSLQ